MLLQLDGIGNQKIAYKDHSQLEFDSLKEYITLAKKSISKFANSIYSGLSKKMLQDEDAISLVANSIMMADWRWDENYQNAKGTKKNKYSYRNQCAIWAIKTYITKKYKKSKYIDSIYSLDFILNEEDGSDSYSYIDSNIKSPDILAQEKEDSLNFQELVDNLFSIECLTDRQKDYIRLYYLESYTFEKIGQKYGITREAVRQGLNKSIETIKQYV
jgi:RNA polymerase sigma factor (sigma-70 family)